MTWFFEGCPGLVPEHCAFIYRTMTHVMESSGSSSDSQPSYINSHTLGTLNDGKMGLVGAYLVMMAHKWAESSYAGKSTPKIIFHQNYGRCNKMQSETWKR
jgi:hypothetical protein